MLRTNETFTEILTFFLFTSMTLSNDFIQITIIRMKISMNHQMLASVSLLIAFEVLLKMKVQKLMIMLKDTFPQHILYKDCCCCSVVTDVRIAYVVGDEVLEECSAVFAVVDVDAQDDFDEDYGSFVDVVDIFVVANDAVFVVDDN